MADTLYFSRDTQVFIKIGSNIWSMPVLDGFSFSQATNASEITLNEMADTSGNSRRGRQMFTDSYAPAEWSFSTYMRPFKSAGSGAGAADDTQNSHHAVEEVLWALMVGNATYSNLHAEKNGSIIGGEIVGTVQIGSYAFHGTLSHSLVVYLAANDTFRWNSTYGFRYGQNTLYGYLLG